MLFPFCECFNSGFFSWKKSANHSIDFYAVCATNYWYTSSFCISHAYKIKRRIFCCTVPLCKTRNLSTICFIFDFTVIVLFSIGISQGDAEMFIQLQSFCVLWNRIGRFFFGGNFLSGLTVLIISSSLLQALIPFNGAVWERNGHVICIVSLSIWLRYVHLQINAIRYVVSGVLRRSNK